MPWKTASPGSLEAPDQPERQSAAMDVAPRFLRLADVAEILNVSESQARALVKRGELLGIQIGGRGQWRVERSVLEAYIQERYADARRLVDDEPIAVADGLDSEVD
jgi:excisionase family DNA binding protein